MRKLIAFATMILAAATLNVSCEGVENKVDYHADLASLVDGTPESGNFYVIFDDNQKAYVTNSNQFTIPKEAYTDGEARAIIQYSIDGSKSGYDKAIKIASIYPIVTDPVYIKTENPLDFNSMKASFDISNAYIARDYINIGLKYMYNENPTSHSFYLIYNADPDSEKDGLFKGHYMNDGYLHLELFHDPGRDINVETYESYVSFKFKPEDLEVNIDDYVGIKLLYRSLKDNNNINEFTIKFK